MANIGENAVFIVINADNKTQSVIDQVKNGLKGMEASNQSTAQKMQSQWEKYASRVQALFAGWLGLQGLKKAWDMANKAAQYNEQMESLNALAAAYHMSGQTIVDSVQKAAGGLISMADAAKMSSKALELGLDPQQVTAFTQVATKLSHVLGGDVASVYDRLTVAAASGRTQTLALMGVNVDLKKAYAEMAAQLHVNVNDLTAQEKEQARLTTILDAARRSTAALGTEWNSSADQMRRLKASMDDLQLVIGQGLLRAGMALYGVFQWVAAGALNVAGGIAKLVSWGAKLTDLAHITHGASQRFADVSSGMFGAAQQLAGKAVDSFKGATASASDFAQAMAKPQAYNEAANGLGKVSHALNKVASVNKQIQGQIDRMTMSQAQLAQQQAAEWTKEGANRQQVETWLHDKLAALEKQAADKKARTVQANEAKISTILQNYAAMNAQTEGNSAQKQLAAMDAKWVKEYQKLEKLNATKEQLDNAYTNFLEAREAKVTQMQQKAAAQREKLHQQEIQQEERMEAASAMNFRRQYEATWSYILHQADSVGGKMGQAMKQMFTGMKGISDIKTGQDPWSHSIAQMGKAQDDLFKKYRAGLIQKSAYDQQYSALSVQMEASADQQKVALYSSGVDMMAGLADSLYQALGQKQGAAFTAYKAFSIAQTAIKTYEGAMAAYSSLAGIPIVGPALGAAAFAAVMATGIAQVAKIAAMQPGSGASGASAPKAAASSSKSSTKSASTGSATSTSAAQPQVIINVQGNLVDHDQFARQVYPSIVKAINAGVH